MSQRPMHVMGPTHPQTYGSMRARVTSLSQKNLSDVQQHKD
eukprot:CAMPEP_0113981024 /NCGR_PEP_ID=MMETSP0328-20130328/3666_1 /TAXON_ID=39455 /ORGANISM="Alexandrium minutum" /LENGTH=40 /assembly_acc=CAM_ASM_000350